MPDPQPSVWYVTADRAPVVWGTAVSGGRATVRIYRLRRNPGTGNQVMSLFAAAGAAVSEEAVARAQDETTAGPVPADRVPVDTNDDGPFLSESTARGTYTPMSAGLRYGPRCVFMGDSITACDSDATANVQGNSWATYFAIASGGRARLVRNSGIGGNTSAQMLARFTADVLDHDPDVVLILAGTNDLGSADPMATAKANITAMVNAALTAGVRPVLATIPPSGTAALPSPGSPSVLTNSTTGGTIPAGTYSFSISAVNGVGETTGGGILTNVVTTGSTSSLTINWPVVQGASGYNVYMNNGSEWRKVATLGTINGSTWVALQATTITAFAGTVGVPGSNTTAKAITTNDRTNIPKINRWVKRYAAANNLDVIDFYSMLVDPATGQFLLGYTRDGTHPTPKASRIMGATAWAQMAERWSRVTPALTADNSDPTNLLTNSTFQVSSGGLPTNWSSSGGLGSSFVDAVGAVAAFTSAGYLGNAFTTTRSVPEPRFHAGPAVSTGFSVGDRIAFAVALQTTGVEAAGGQVNVDLKCVGSSPTKYVQAAQIGGDIGPGVLYGEFVVPAGTTSLQPDQHITNGVGTQSVITAQWTVVNLTTGGLLTP